MQYNLKRRNNMKKLLSLFVACILLISACPALADELDLSYVEANQDIYVLDRTDDDYYFIDTVLSASDLHFEHRYESDAYWNYTFFDILCLDATSDEPCPIWRLWIRYASELAYQNIDSITFEINGKRFTFSDVSEPEWLQMRESTYIEDMLIVFGEHTMDFIVELKKARKALNDIDDFSCTMTLHGDEDIVTTLGGNFLLDFILMDDAFMAMDGLDYIDLYTGTTMTVN